MYPAHRIPPHLGYALPKSQLWAKYLAVEERKQNATQRGATLRIVALAFALLSALPLSAAPFRLLAIGDSLSKEYKYETIGFNQLALGFSGPNSDPSNANTKNWVELLVSLRSSQFSMGPTSDFLDYRFTGHEYNYSVPGFKAQRWVKLLSPTNFNLLDLNTRLELSGDLGSVHAVLIFVGGNDLALTNSDAQNDAIRQHIANIHSYVRAYAPTGKPIIIATVPDIGATHAEKLSDPVQAAAARQRVATLNANIIAMAASLPNTYIARIDAITDRIYDQVPFHINGTVFTYPPNVENPPLHIFCKDGFHPSTGAQALIANEILKAINTIAATPIPLFANREILTILSQNPDQPLIDYIGGAPEDGDGVPALIEYLLGTDPGVPNSPFTFSTDGSASYTPSTTALRFADLSVLQSATLTDDWIAVPPANILAQPGGAMKIIPNTPKLFYKFLATPKP
jgi:lysophospholipase L1-like esterase